MFLFSTAFAEGTEPAATAQPTFFQTIVDKFSEITWSTWLILAALVALGVILLVAAKSSKRWTAKMLAYAALSVALSFVLSYIRLYKMPQGGSITLASMLPLLLFSASFGVGPGVVAGLSYGLLQYLQDGYFLNVWQFLLDYPIAFAALGLAGLYKHMNKPWIPFAALAATLVALVCIWVGDPQKWVLYLSLALIIVALGVLLALKKQGGELMPAFTLAVLGRGISALGAGFYWLADPSLSFGAILSANVVYNGIYLVPELVICLALSSIVGPRILKMMKA